MKRLRKLATNQTLYHGTNMEGLLGITSSGSVSPSGNATDYGERIANYTFYGSREKAEKYSKATGNTNYDLQVLLTVQIDDTVLLPDDIHSRESKTWKQSLDSVGQVKVEGSVPADNISNVEISSGKLGLLVSTNIGSWEDELATKIKEVYGIDGQLNEMLLVFAKGVNYPTLQEQQQTASTIKNKLKKLSRI